MSSMPFGSRGGGVRFEDANYDPSPRLGRDPAKAVVRARMRMVARIMRSEGCSIDAFPRRFPNRYRPSDPGASIIAIPGRPLSKPVPIRQWVAVRASIIVDAVEFTIRDSAFSSFPRFQHLHVVQHLRSIRFHQVTLGFQLCKSCLQIRHVPRGSFVL